VSKFDALAAKLASHGAQDPKALAAHIGNKKYGKAAMQKLAAAGRKKKAGTKSRPDVGTCVRAFDFEASSVGDGRTLEGYAAVFDTVSRIADMFGDFDEVIRPGAFARTLQQRTPVLQFEHGRDPRVGAVPIGAIDTISEDSKGLYVRARLFDNPTVEPVRQAIAATAIKGMSFRFSVPDGGDKWSDRVGDVELREIFDTDTRECGPVVFPAYDATTVTVRSLLAQLDPTEHRNLIRELAAELRAVPDLSDLTGRPGARSAGGGDTGLRPANGDGPNSSTFDNPSTRHEVLRALGVI
jgi:HK97 family phage prohead protease